MSFLIKMAGGFILFFSTLSVGFSQTKEIKLHLPLKKQSLKFSYFPFGNVIVLDNRNNPLPVFAVENGEFPRKDFVLDGTATDVFKSYIDKATAGMKKGNETLLINVRELHIPNNGVYDFFLHNSIYGHRRYYTRDYLRFFSEIYILKDSARYQKIAELRFLEFMRPLANGEAGEISFLLNVMLKFSIVSDPSAITKQERNPFRKGDTSQYHFSTDTALYTIDQIDIPASIRWSKTPIMNTKIIPGGYFENFNDFIDNKIFPVSIAMKYKEADSSYAIDEPDTNSLKKLITSWVVSSGGRLFIRIGDNSFLPLFKRNDRFEFYIPHSFPDMYTMLSLKEKARLEKQEIGLPLHFGVIGDLAAIFLSGALNMINNSTRPKNIPIQNSTDQFRNCFIDVESGDIIY